MTKPTPGRYAEYKKEEVIDTEGNCVWCGNYSILGNGLCVDCWKKQTNKMTYKQLGA